MPTGLSLVLNLVMGSKLLSLFVKQKHIVAGDFQHKDAVLLLNNSDIFSIISTHKDTLLISCMLTNMVLLHVPLISCNS